MNTRERLGMYVKKKGLGQTAVEEQIGLSKGTIARKSNFLNGDSLEKIASHFPDLSMNWLLTGIGDEEIATNDVPQMLTESQNKGGTPYYQEFLDSSISNACFSYEDLSPSGYINIPGVDPDAYFRCVGVSYQTEIRAGDIIGVNLVQNWTKFDPDKLYLILQLDGDKMIKHLGVEKSNKKIVRCFSDDYKDDIEKSDIRAIFHIVFWGRVK